MKPKPKGKSQRPSPSRASKPPPSKLPDGSSPKRRGIVVKNTGSNRGAVSAPILPFTLRLPTGLATVRYLHADDQQRLIDFFNTHTIDTIRSRYGYLVARMSPERAAQLVGVDQSRDAALGVFQDEENGPALIAVGRCCALTSLRSAEVAFIVREDRRRLGIASLLFSTLVGIMRERGVTQLFARVQRDNEAMLEVFRRAGAQLKGIPDSGDVEMTLEIEKPGASKRDSER